MFGHVTLIEFNSCCSVPNFIKIGRFFTEMWRFNDFQNDGMRGNKTPGRIVTNFCTRVGVDDVITSANFFDYHLWGLGVVGVKCWASPLTCVVTITTLSHYRASV